MGISRVGTILGALALVVSAGLTAVARAEPAPVPPPPPFRVALIGDSGYNADGERNFLRIRDSINAARPAFTVHDGDIWMGGTSCNDDRLRTVKATFNGFAGPLVYTPGDNEWVDCPQGPDGRLAAIREVFFSTPQSLGAAPMEQRRQVGTPENARWEWGNVVFATLNVPGPIGGGPDSADLAWLDNTFDRARDVKARAVMIIWQDDPTDGSSPALVAELKERAAAFKKPVMLVHGDTHQYKLDNPWREVRNLTRLETFPTFTPEWVKVTVDPSSPAVFTVARLRGQLLPRR